MSRVLAAAGSGVRSKTNGRETCVVFNLTGPTTAQPQPQPKDQGTNKNSQLALTLNPRIIRRVSC